MFSTFDINLVKKEYTRYAHKFGADNILLVKRSYVYKFIYILAPSFSFWILFILFLLFGILNNISYDLYWFVKFSFFIFCLFVFIGVLTRKILSYYMDFTIVTPGEIVQYNQKWFFSRPIKSISAQKIKSIIVQKDWFLQSFFDYWDILLSSEWDQQWVSDLVLKFVKNPEKTRSVILEILKII